MHCYRQARVLARRSGQRISVDVCRAYTRLQYPVEVCAKSSDGERVVLIFSVRGARLKAIEAAKAEALSLFSDLAPTMLKGGPLSDQAGNFWVEANADDLTKVEERAARLGYSHTVRAVRLGGVNAKRARGNAHPTWKGRPFHLDTLYEEDPDAHREFAPDRRTFILPTENGGVREVRGYRGDSDPLSRRGLPVADARLLVNLSLCALGRNFLDAFAGAGGIVVEARRAGLSVFSVDVDKYVMYGLQHQGAHHCVADSRQIPFRDATFDSIASEAPFDAGATEAVVSSLAELTRVLKVGGKMALMVASDQVPQVRASAQRLPLILSLDCPIDRKGLPVAIFVWTKDKDA